MSIDSRLFITRNKEDTLSVGYWGSCDEIMMVVAKAIKEFGDVYYDFNDCDDLDFIKL